MVMEIVVSLVLLFVGIAVLIVIHVCIVGRAFRRAYGNGAMVQRVAPSGLCRLLREFQEGDKCRLLPNSEHNLIPESKLQTLAIHWDSGLLHLHLVGGIKVIGLRSDPRKYYSLEKYVLEWSSLLTEDFTKGPFPTRLSNFSTMGSLRLWFKS
ncbi:hypothetical protein AAG906_001209 [Vitis piasezkii]